MLPDRLPPVHLLRTGGTVPLVNAAGLETARRCLEMDARLLLAVGEDDPWLACARPAFGRAVGRVRRQLEPIGDGNELVASFAREAARLAQPDRPAGSITPLRAAYAIRWLELRSGLRLPAWRHWLDACSPGR